MNDNTLYHDLLAKFRTHVKALLSCGAKEEEAHAIAGALVVNEPSSYFSQIVDEKSACQSKVYIYRGTVLNLIDAKVSRRQAGDQLILEFLTKVGSGNKRLTVKGNQALTILALIMLKFERFTQDLCEGFTWQEVSNREGEIISTLLPRGFSLPHSNIAANMHRLRISEKMKTLQLENFILHPQPSTYRIEFGPNNIRFTDSAREFCDSLSSDDAVSRWFSERGSIQDSEPRKR